MHFAANFKELKSELNTYDISISVQYLKPFESCLSGYDLRPIPIFLSLSYPPANSLYNAQKAACLPFRQLGPAEDAPQHQICKIRLMLGVADLPEQGIRSFLE